MFVSYYLHKFLKLYVSHTKEMSQLQKQPSEVFYWKSSSYKFRRKHVRYGLFLIEFQAQVWTANVLRDFNKGFFCEYWENFKKTYFQENLQITASAVPASYCKIFFLGASFCS